VKQLILGGARSGKSALAESLARASGLAVSYVATAGADDAEMAERIARHRARRSPDWQLIEERQALAAALRRAAAPDRCVVVDCLTLWLSNLLDEPAAPERWPRERSALLDELPGLPGSVILVSNEVGAGVVPANALARRFRDEAGRLHQDLAAVCDRVTLVVAGLPLHLKGG
jgi:adenosylcobinamide kinase/adenosylcobinamide-phosphate guanylyltransferase